MKALQSLLLLLIFIASCKTNVQKPLRVNLDFHRPALNSIDSIENANNGIRIYKPYKISVSKDYFPNADKFNLGIPLIFLRDTSTLRTAVTYFFSEPDSLIRLVEYSWNSTGRSENEVERLFRHNDSTITSQLNKSGIQTIDNQDTWSQVTKIWNNDSIYVEQFMVIQGTPGRTRVLVSWH